LQGKVRYVSLCTPFCAVQLCAKHVFEDVVISLELGEEEQEVKEEERVEEKKQAVQ
jgi:hypothetical protein